MKHLLHPKHWDAIIIRSLMIACTVVLIGTAGYTWIEGWSLWKSLFFTLVTLSTVGYGDYGLTEGGERFTAVLLVGGIGTVSITIGQILQRIMSKMTQPELRMIEQIKKMQDHVIVCGLGRTGSRVIERMIAAGQQVAVIDNNERLVQNARKRGCVAITGDATSDEALLDAGLMRASSLAAVTSSDAVNAMICLSAHALAPELNIIARAEDESSISKLKRAGANEVLSPSSYGGDGIAQQILHPKVASLMPGLQGPDAGLSFVEFIVDRKSETIAELGARHPRLVFIAARNQAGDVMLRPGGDQVLSEGDVLIIAGEPSEVESLRSTKAAA